MSRVLRISVLAAAMIATAVPAFAQLAQPVQRKGRPVRGLFGSGVGDTGQSLILNMSFGGGYDKDMGGRVDSGGTTTTVAPWTGGYGSASGNLAYSLSRKKVTTTAMFGGSAHLNPKRTGDNVLTSIGGSLGLSYRLAARTTATASAGVSRQPFNIQRLYGSWFDANSVPDVLFDLSGVAGNQTQYVIQAATGLAHNLTNRVALNAGYQHHNYSSWSGSSGTGSTANSALVGMSYQVFRGARLRVGYGYTETHYGKGPSHVYKGPSADGGLDFDRAISITRRSSLSFGTGVTGALDEVSQRTHYFLTGQASYNYEIGRSWTAVAHYRRGVDFNQGFSLPMVLDTASGGVAGALSRRMHFSTNAGSSWGRLGVTSASPKFTAFTGSASLRYALTRTVGISTQYAYRHYHFDQNAALPLGLNSDVERHSIRINLDLWLPLMTVSRRPDASR